MSQLRFTIVTHLKHTHAEYHVLTVFETLKGIERIKVVHTAKKLPYLAKLIKERYSR